MVIVHPSRCVAIPQLSELLSELIWRVVGGTLPKEVAVSYLASEHPFEKRLGAGNSSDWRVTSPAAEVLCDTLWGVDAMVRNACSLIGEGVNTLTLPDLCQFSDWAECRLERQFPLVY